jgi:hypothetical protein
VEPGCTFASIVGREVPGGSESSAEASVHPGGRLLVSGQADSTAATSRPIRTVPATVTVHPVAFLAR